MDSFGTKSSFKSGEKEYQYFDLNKFADNVGMDLNDIPFSLRILLENMLRNEDGRILTKDDIGVLADWGKQNVTGREVAYMPARVLMQDFTGVPAVVDFAALRDAMAEMGGEPEEINPLVPASLIIDHSVQVDSFGDPGSQSFNEKMEFERNHERYQFLRWGQQAFSNLQIVPPGSGIIHQINLEYLASLVSVSETEGGRFVYPDTLVGTDSHTTMINGLGVMGWGVGGIEAEAVMLGEPYYMLLPEVVGVRLSGRLPERATATDLVLTVTSQLRELGVVGKFVEYFGPGVKNINLTDRAVLANMAPEYGATMGFFPVDDKTISYLELTGRDPQLVRLAETYCRKQNLFSDQQATPLYSETIEIDMGTVEPAMAGPKLPYQGFSLKDLKESFYSSMNNEFDHEIPEDKVGKLKSDTKKEARENIYADSSVDIEIDSQKEKLTHGSVVIAALSSCTNTSSPELMIGAGLLARKARQKGLIPPAYVKTSLAPGSRAVTGYLDKLGLLEDLEALNFNLVGYGCSSCIGNSGPLPAPVEKAIKENNLVAASVICGNRNFEGRISPLTLANYLASPPLVVAVSLAGTVDIDFTSEPLATDSDGQPVYLDDIWPTQAEVDAALEDALSPELFKRKYSDLFEGSKLWENIEIPEDKVYNWASDSTYIKCPPFFEGMEKNVTEPENICGARCLATFGDSVTTDHISPAGAIPVDSPAGRYLKENGVGPGEFNTYGSRRGNHEVMMRGTFGNIRLDNNLVEEQGGYTRYFPAGDKMFIYDAAMKYISHDVPLIVLAGKQYGTGSSRDWAAKGTELLGVKIVIAESYERIHRANLIGMGVLPAQFEAGKNWENLGLTGDERYSVSGIDSLEPGKSLDVTASRDNGEEISFEVTARLDSAVEVEYYRSGGILRYVLRQLLD
jgi:aconitate hydratase